MGGGGILRADLAGENEAERHREGGEGGWGQCTGAKIKRRNEQDWWEDPKEGAAVDTKDVSGREDERGWWEWEQSDDVDDDDDEVKKREQKSKKRNSNL